MFLHILATFILDRLQFSFFRDEHAHFYIMWKPVLTNTPCSPPNINTDKHFRHSRQFFVDVYPLSGYFLGLGYFSFQDDDRISEALAIRHNSARCHHLDIWSTLAVATCLHQWSN
jgi:hypothetical protein